MKPLVKWLQQMAMGNGDPPLVPATARIADDSVTRITDDGTLRIVD